VSGPGDIVLSELLAAARLRGPLHSIECSLCERVMLPAELEFDSLEIGSVFGVSVFFEESLLWRLSPEALKRCTIRYCCIDSDDCVAHYGG